MAEYSRAGQQIWMTKGHLAALGVAMAAIAVLAFLVGLEVGKGTAEAEEPAEPGVAAFLPDASDEQALEALLREVERAQAELDQPDGGGDAEVTFNRTLVEELPEDAPEQPPPSAVVSDLEARPDEAPQPPAEPISAGAPTSGWAVQIASYEDQAEADAHVARLVELELPAYRVAGLVSGQTWHRVRIGGYADQKEALDAREGLGATLGLSDLMVAQAP